MYIRNMVYRFKITLAGIKGFFRIYLVNDGNTLYKFHKQIQSDLEFPADQQILFKAMDAGDALVGRFALVDLGFGTVDKIRIGDLVKAGTTSLIYFYDIAAKKNVIITLEGEEKGVQVNSPRLIESKGPVPLEFENGYVAFEDLPEDQKRRPVIKHFDLVDEDVDVDEDDDSEDEADDDKEEEEVIYDENESL